MSPWDTEIIVVYFYPNRFNLHIFNCLYFGLTKETSYRIDYLRGNCTSFSSGVSYQNTFNPLWF